MNTKRIVLLSLAVVGVYAGITLYGDVSRLRGLLARYAWWTFAASLGLAAANYGLRFLKWQYYLKLLHVRGVPWTESLAIFLSGFVMSITPAKAGEVFKSALLASAHGVPIARSAPIVVADRLTDLVSLIVLVALGGLYFPGGLVPAVLASTLVTGLLVFVFVPPLGEWVITLSERFAVGRRLAPRLREAYASLRLLAGPRALLWPTALSLVAWACECAALWLIVRGLGGGASLAVSFFVYATATVAGAVAMLPGGLGGTEVMMISLLQGLTGGGVSETAASAATLLVRLATLWFAVGVGAVALVVFRRRFDRHRDVAGVEAQGAEARSVGPAAS